MGRSDRSPAGRHADSGGRAEAGCDAEAAAARRRLSQPDRSGLSRRRFLQAGLAGAGLAVLSGNIGGPFGRALAGLADAATPVAPGQGILVVILLGGGNDGMSMVVPASDSAYYAARGSLAVPADTVLPLAGGFGFHPSLPKLAARYAQGQVACVMGVDYPNPDLSHFTSMQNWMTGQPGAGGRLTGWLGRCLDATGNPDGLTGVAISSSVPLHMVGATTAATALSVGLSSQFSPKPSDVPDTRLLEAMSSFAVGPTGLGHWGDAVAANNALSLGLAAELLPMYSPALPTGSLATQMALAARLINANLGIRVLGVEMSGDFDVHSDEANRYPTLMAGLDDGIDAFYAALSPAWSGAVSLMTFSEFGRRVKANNSGTDHGTASTLLVIGDKVKGGMATEAPSLTNLDPNGNLVMTTDYRSVYSAVISDWLQGDPQQVLGGAYPALSLFNSTPTNPVNPSAPAGGGAVPAPTRVTPAGPGYWLVGQTGTVYPFNAAPMGTAGSVSGVVAMAPTPDGRGAWITRSNGTVQPVGTAPYVGDAGAERLARPIVGMAATPTGRGYWLVASDGGIFSFGDAGFFGSTGAERLARPIVGMAPTPTGKGYWLVASDGGVFTFGDAPFQGGLGGSPPQHPIVGVLAA